VTLDEARELLGVAAGDDARSTRRAYFRAVKTHPPERDAQGLARIREAWELCRGADEHAAAVANAPSATASDEELFEQLSRARQSEPLIDDAALDLLVLWDRYDRLLMRDDMDAVLALLRGGCALGLPGFREELGSRFPDTLSDEGFEQECETRPRALLEDGLPRLLPDYADRAVLLMVCAMDDCEARGGSVQQGDVVRVTLACVVLHDLVDARMLIEQFQRLREQLGWAGAWANGSPQWRMLTELVGLEDDFPEPIRMELARCLGALCTGDKPDVGKLTALRLANAREAGEAWRMLRRRAPELLQRFGAHLLYSHEMATKSLSRSSRVPRWMLPLLALGAAGFVALRFLLPPPPNMPPRSPTRGTMRSAPPAAYVPDVEARTFELQQVVERACQATRTGMCGRLADVQSFVEQGACNDARMGLATVQSDVGPYSELVPQVADRQKISAAVESVCALDALRARGGPY